jgi:hypothetical protein
MGFFWCGIMNIHNNKLVYDAYNKLGEYIYILKKFTYIYKNLINEKFVI